MMYSFGRQVLPVDAHVGRVLSQLDLMRDLGLSLEGLEHKQLQAVLADLVPPPLRYSLHREPSRPREGECVVHRNLSLWFLRSSRLLFALPTAGGGSHRGCFQATHRRSFFCGAGGLWEGFQQTGFDVAVALDADPIAMRTYRFDPSTVARTEILARDIRTLGPRESCVVWSAGSGSMCSSGHHPARGSPTSVIARRSC